MQTVADRRLGALARLRHHRVELLLVGVLDAHRVERRALALERAEERDDLVDAVVLVQRDRELERVERARHLDRAGRVHVGRDDRDAGVVGAGVPEPELARDVDLRARRQRRALGPDQHVLEVELDVVLDAHGRFRGARGRKKRRAANAGPTLTDSTPAGRPV
jgi:hypothetical protein